MSTNQLAVKEFLKNTTDEQKQWSSWSGMAKELLLNIELGKIDY